MNIRPDVEAVDAALWELAREREQALRGLAGAFGLAALVLLALFVLELAGVWSGVTLSLGPWWHNARWPGLALALFILPLRLYSDLFTWLFLLPAATKRFGVWPGAAMVVALSTVVFWPPLMVDPAPGFLAIGAVRATVLAVLFLRYDFLTTLLAGMGSSMLLSSLPFLMAGSPALIFQGALPLAIVALPLVLSARYLGSDQELTYRWEDVPPHVRRIAERERQRVELETARQIQSSILPDLPPRLAGIDLAHCYLPATEVGGDFYDVLALEDGRLAVAVGDVAGHGVSSGLIMSMAKSTLALQVTVNPEAQAVFQTLNRTVYQSARLRLLTTLCYALVDRERRELIYASAGHLAPYRIDAQGKVEALIAGSYPLGVRGELDVRVRTIRLEPGDRLFLYSDGVVEARRGETDEVFGFERLEASLARHAEADPAGLRDGVLEDVRKFTGNVPRDDDQTILVLRVP
ncbi:MAG: PP2C family protein-serine/threonine phosphatase [Thermoanaerobaculia bacterium]|nr:PP2C family protein-serine/threonine phosphatase [Thermoanaerobaculia bacterium]